MKKYIKLLSVVTALAVLLSVLSGCTLIAGQTGDTEDAGDGTVYEVDSSHFTLLSSAFVRESEGSERYGIRLAVESDISIFEYSLTVKAYNANGTVVHTETLGATERVERGATFAVFIEMSKIIADSITEVEAVCTAKSYTNPATLRADTRPRVTFYVKDTLWARYAEEVGGEVTVPASPATDGLIFVGWYTDASYTERFDFSGGVADDTSVYARLIPDAMELTNEITTSVISSAVTVRCTYNALSPFTPSASSVSSGVVISNGTDAYILTNCHSVQLLSGYAYVAITVEDYLGNTYSAEVYEVGGTEAIDPAYDLACLVVSGGMGEDVKPIEFADGNPSVGDAVISLGSPGGQQNAVTYGTVEKYASVNIDIEENMSNVTFPAVNHTALIKGGSSGGALLDHSLKLVGINYAGTDEEFGNGYAIPLEKVNEFLDLYLYQN